MLMLKQKVRGLIGRYGPVRLKRRLWDAEFSSGKWDGLKNMAGDCLYPTVEHQSHGGTILDLGCGPGATANELAAESYSWYTGVDISEVALQMARSRAVEAKRDKKSEYIRFDISAYSPTRFYDVILFGDSLYYVPERNIPAMLKKYERYLSSRGVFIVRIKGVRSEWFKGGATSERGHWARRKAIVSMIMSDYQILDRELFEFSDTICVMVFRPKST